MSRSCSPLVLIVQVLTVLCCAARPLSADTPLVAEEIRQLMQDRDYAAAIEAIDAAVGAKDAPADYLTYLKGRAFYLRKEYDKSAAAFDVLEEKYPDSQWRRRARFAKALAWARKGDYRTAELIVRAEADYLLSADRKQQIADIYLEFADNYFKPPQDEEQPDYGKALQFYQEALKVGPKPASRIEVELRVALCYQNTENTEEAANRYEQFIEAHPASPLDVEARFQLGECQLSRGQLNGARRTWEDLLAKHGEVSSSERIAEATFRLSRTWQIPEPRNNEQLSLGTAALKRFIERFPLHELAGKAHLEIAQSYVHRDRHEEAVAALKLFLADERFKDREEIPTARDLLGRSYQLQKKFAEALATWKDYLSKHPAHKAWSAVQRQIIDTEYLMASEKIDAKDYDAANRLFGEFLAKYPLDGRNPNILLLMNQKLTHEEKWDEAIAAWRRIVSKYPGSNEASLAQLSIADTLEQKLGKLEAALDEYRKVTWGSSQTTARQAVARLTAKSMTVATERVFRSDETPRLKLTTRNIETVTVRAYGVDMETYFRKMHLAEGVETLDIALIDPDRTFQFKVPEYQKYQKLENHIEVPLAVGGEEGGEKGETCGVTAITVSSKTLEATALVIQSDLDVIVKSSRDEVFVLAENMLTGKPWPGARLLLSDGKEVFAEAVTGADGVFQQSYEQLKQADDVRVFAVGGENIASNLVSLRGISSALGLTDKGYVYTDRPAYRAGQIVHVRGCLRRVGDDTYKINQGKQYTLQVLDNRARPVHSEEVELNDFGSFHLHFAIPATAPQGEYRILATDADGKNFQGAFKVREYKLEPMHLTIDVPRRVFYRGEQIEGTIRAAYYYGAPLAGRKITYQLADQRQHTATTDRQGEVAFKLPTREFFESQTLALNVSLPDHNLSKSVNFLLATRGFSIGVGSVRPVYVAGETFEVTVNTSDAKGKPVGRELKLKVLEQTTVRNKVGERLVEEHPLRTGDDGKARHTLKLDTGGRYVVRVEGTDRFGGAISGEHPVNISDDEDQVRLRILADEHTFKVGDTAALKLHWREQPALALVTFQGARILDYRLVELKRGLNTLAVPMTARLAPNFDLAVAVMTDRREVIKDDKPVRRFHEASSPFTVERDLRVKIASQRNDGAKGAVRPGKEIEVTVTTTDPQGQPVAAEVSLAMVEQSLLDRFAWPMPAIDDFFRGRRRQSAVRTTSSITFDYRPATQPINPRLLAEADRLEIAREEAESREDGSLFAFGSVDTSGVPFDDADPFAPPRSLSHHRGSQDGIEVEFVEELEEDPFGEGLVVRRHGGMAAFGAYGGNARAAATPDSLWESNGDGGFSYFAGFANGHATGHIAGQQPDPWIHETGYWNPAVVTGDDGRASVTFTMPERSTAWQLVAKGITVETLAGETTDELKSKRDLFAQLKLPSAFTDGDEAEVIASIHNDVLQKGRIDVTLKTTIGGRTVEEKKTIDVEAKGIHELAFKTVLKRPEMPEDNESAVAPEVNAIFELTIEAGRPAQALTYKLRRSVPLKPYGMPVFVTAAGSATSDTTVWVAAPKTIELERPGLQILIGPTIEQSLLDIVLGTAPWCQIESSRVTAPLATATSNLMAALALQDLMRKSRDSESPQATALGARVRSALSLLISAQNDEGGWSWTGRGGKGQRDGTARIVWALSLARRAGYVVPQKTYNAALGLLQEQVAAADNTDYHGKAILLHALSTAGRGDFSLANRLYRSRQSLSSSALVYLALALIEMDRKTTAGEVLDLLATRDVDGAIAPAGLSPWSHPLTELQALRALAVGQVKPQSPEAGKLADWLMVRRTGHRWVPDRATGPAAMALGRWYGEHRHAGERYRLTVFVNDVRVKVLDVDPAAGTVAIDVTGKLLKPGTQRVTFQIAGRGRYSYQCILGGFVAAEKLKNTTRAWRVERTYQPAPLEVDGREVPRGFSNLQGSYKPFINPLTQLPVGRRGAVRLKVSRYAAVGSEALPRDMEYLVVTEPIPSGAAVIEQSISGPFDWYEIGPGAITFYLGNRPASSVITYDLYGYAPGAYRAAPTVVRNAHRPDQFAVGWSKPLAVLPSGAKSTDQYRLTPDELLYLGKHYFDKGEMKTAGLHLAELIGIWKNLGGSAYRQAVQMLLDVHLRIGPPAEVVRYFEIVKERWPETQIPFDKIVKVGAAYHEMGEYERSYLVFRATVESSFMRESGVAGFLDAQGEFTRSVDVMDRLLRAYPPEGYLASATYGLAQRVYAKAPEAAADPKLRRAKINRVDLIRRAWAMLESFLTAYPEDPAADQAAFATANTLLDLKDYQQAVDACNRYAKRYPASDLLDTYWYIIGYCHFATSRHQEALDTCRKVAEHRRIDKRTGREVESSNKHRAIYILGQVYHSLGQAADAVREYRRVAERFVDARQSIDYFLRKAIVLPEVTTVRPGEAAKVELKFRNIAACDAKVYRIDLMKFSLLKRNLGGITRINLAGIRPYHQVSVELGDGKDYRDRTHKLAMPLKQEGAYLVVCRGENLHASGLVLVTPLAVEVREEITSGRVRTTVKDVSEDRYLRDVHVKVIGSGNEDFISGETDLRGVFVADGVQGAPTVIAQAEGGRYAFYRSKHLVHDGRFVRRYPRQSGKLKSVDLAETSEAELRIREALKSNTVMEFVETPLTDVADYIRDYHGLGVQIDTKALDDVGIGTDTPITRNLKGISLRSALRLILRELDLTYVIQDEVLLITTPEEAETRLATKVYPVADLVGQYVDESGQSWCDFDSLIEMISSTVQPTTWDEVGGPGSICGFEENMSLVLAQTDDVHEEIEQLLEKLRRIKAEQGGGQEKPAVRARPQRGFGGMGGGFGGMGGMGGGMGGMGGGMAAPAAAVPGASLEGDLLRGLQDTNRAFQGKQVDQLKKMYNSGMGGVGAGAAF